MINEILSHQDAFEIIGDKIAAILLAETAPTKSLRIFRERAMPWSFFQDAPHPQADPPVSVPIVNIWFSGATFEERSSNVVERQRGTSTYYIDVYGYGISTDDPDGGHVPGDEAAARAAHKGVRIVRNILMSAKYTYLDLRGTVGRRWIQSIETFQPAMDSQPVQRIVGARIHFQVDHNEFSPQVEGAVLEEIALSVRRHETGELYFTAEYQHGE